MSKRKKKPKKKKSLSVNSLIKGSALIGCALFLTLSLLTYCEGDATQNWLGLVGHVMGWSVHYLFGLASLLIPVFLGWLGWQLITKKEIHRPRLKICYFLLIMSSSATLLAQVAHSLPAAFTLFDRWVYSDFYPKGASYHPDNLRHYIGGVPFHHLYIDTALNLRSVLGGVGTFLVALSLFFVSGMLLTEIPLSYFLGKCKLFYSWLTRPRKRKPLPVAVPAPKTAEPYLARENPLTQETRINIPDQPKLTKSLPSTPKRVESLDDYTLPPASLLTEVAPVDQSSLKNDLKRQAEVLEETLLSFGIEAKVGNIHCGPTVTSFEVHPAVGVKVQKIKALENDIALNMQAKSIRIIAPIPGKAAVGIEVPNPHPQEVSFRDLLESYQAGSKKGHIPLLLGKMVNGENVWSDLTKMPHLIIAGATGSGKSVCINTIVMSLVMNVRPDEIKILMVDPNKVELTAYTHLPHMLAPVITEPGGACSALGWLVQEMERRYEIFRQLGIRNILGFNSRKINQELETSLDLEIPEKLPYIVVIIDELADLMMVSSSDIETPIARIAQMARAVGIHMILATQRPSREVITGLIKANFPCRIAFKVSSRINSQIIIDENGAETLLGNGDMLFLPPGTSSLLRAQGAFIRDDDINDIIHYVCSQSPTNYLIPSFDNYRLASDDGLGGDSAPLDPLYEDAKALVFETGNASTTFLQRKMKVGYARAASLMDQMEANGIIGPSVGAKPRQIFYPQQED